MGNIRRHIVRTLPGRLEQVLEDPRRCERVWEFGTLLQTIMHALVSGVKTLRELEVLTATSGSRVPDTTMGDLLAQLDAEPLYEELAKGVKQANRQHELDEKELPFQLTIIDGKNLSVTREAVDEYSINRSQKGRKIYANHALRAFHVSSKLKLFLGQVRMRSGTNENGTFKFLFDDLVRRYSRTNLLEVFSMDAGFTGAENASIIVESGYKYIFALKAPEVHVITATAIKLLGTMDCPNKTETECYNGRHIVRHLYRCPAPAVKGWSHAKELWRIEKIITSCSGKVEVENHYYITNIAQSLSDSVVLKTIRAHWKIENNANWVLDVAWREDTRPWCNAALEVLSLLRMIAYNSVARFKLRRLRRATSQNWTWEQTLHFIQRSLFPVRNLQFVTL